MIDTSAIDRLTDIDRHFVKIAEYIATDFVRQLAKGFATERKVDRRRRVSTRQRD